MADRALGASGTPGWKAESALMAAFGADMADKLELFAEDHERALEPVPEKWLANRLSGLQLAFGHITDGDKMTAWLHETMRLLGDLPQDILALAIDEAVKRQARGFVPSVGEIRAVADPLLDARKRTAERLRIIITFRDRPKAARALPTEESRHCTAEEAARIIDEVCPFVRQGDQPKRVRHDGPPRKPTRQDYLDLGVSPDVLDRMVADGHL